MNKDVIERRYLQLKLSRDLRIVKANSSIGAQGIAGYISDLKDWLKQSPRRTKRPGGLGR